MTLHAEQGVLRRRSVANFAGLAAGTALQLALMVVLTRTLAARDLGVFLEAFAIIRVAIVAATVGLDVVAIRYVAHHAALDSDDSARSYAKLSVLGVAAASVLTAATMAVMAPAAAALFHAPELGRVLPIMSIAVPFSVVEIVLVAVSRGRGRMAPYVLIDQLLSGASMVVIVGGAAYAGLGLRGVALGFAFASALPLVAALVVVRPFRLSTRFPARNDTRDALRFAAFQLGSALSGIALLWVDSLILGAIRTPGDVAIYSVSIRFALIGIIFITPVATALQPQIAGYFANRDIGRLGEMYTYATFLAAVYGCLPLVLVIVYGTTLIDVAFGNRYLIGYAPLVAVATGQIVNAATGPCGYVVSMTGRSDLLFRASLISLGINATLSVALIPFFGPLGAGIAAGACYATVNVLRTVYVWRTLHIHPYHRWPLPFVIGLVGAATAATLANDATMGSAIVRLVLGCVAATAVMLGALRAFGLGTGKSSQGWMGAATVAPD